MKKILILLMGVLLLMGCSKKSNIDVAKEFEKKVNKSKSYQIKGNLEIQNDEEIFKYDIDVSYLEKNYYKVEMINTANEHKQIILRNDDGLYVITPALNKSFKFESTWPDNSSQSYILSSLVKDVKNDEKKEIIADDDSYIIKAKVNYPNNEELLYQKIYLDNDFNIKKVEVYSKSDIVKIKMEIKDIDLKAGLNDDIFELKNYIQENECNDEECESDKKSMSNINSAIYPLYMPSNTYLKNTEIVNNENNSRVILTYSGSKNFVLIEEGAVVNLEHEIIPVYGEPIMLNDTIAALSTNSMYWTSNDIDYYMVSEDLSVSEMVFIATSLNNSTSVSSMK
ncbi:MAG: hypothetical protein PUD07_05515 [bacterium]|nr:hypothetical protein [bacterium]